MDFEFYKLADVEVNPKVNKDTYSLVVNDGEVQKTKCDIINEFYKNFTDSFINSSFYEGDFNDEDVINYIKSLVNLESPYCGFIDGSSEDNYYLFTVLGDEINTRCEIKHYFKDSSNNKCVSIYTFYNNFLIEANTYYIDINNKLYHVDGSNELKTSNIDNSSTIKSSTIQTSGTISANNNILTNGNIILNSNGKYIKLSKGNGSKDLFILNDGLEFHSPSNIIYLTNEVNYLELNDQDDHSVGIHGVATPTGPDHAVNKFYVDNIKSNLEDQITALSGSIGFDANGAWALYTVQDGYPVVDSNGTTASFQSTHNNVGAILIGAIYDYTTSVGGVPTTVSNMAGMSMLNYEITGTVGDYTYNFSAYIPKTSSEGSGVDLVTFIYASPTNLVDIPALQDLAYPFSMAVRPDEWYPTVVYSLGDYVFYNGVLYKSKINNNQSATFDSNDWDLVTPRMNISDSLNDISAGVIKADGSVSMENSLNMGNHKIINVSNPVNWGDAVNKNYVDNLPPINWEDCTAEYNSMQLDPYDFIGTMVVDGYWSFNASTAVKYYIVVKHTPGGDQQNQHCLSLVTELADQNTSSLILFVDGNLVGKITSYVTEESISISGLRDPQNSTDAVNKSYVDTNSVLYSSQNGKTSAQKASARSNIDAESIRQDVTADYTSNSLDYGNDPINYLVQLGTGRYLLSLNSEENVYYSDNTTIDGGNIIYSYIKMFEDDDIVYEYIYLYKPNTSTKSLMYKCEHNVNSSVFDTYLKVKDPVNLADAANKKYVDNRPNIIWTDITQDYIQSQLSVYNYISQLNNEGYWVIYDTYDTYYIIIKKEPINNNYTLTLINQMTIGKENTFRVLIDGTQVGSLQAYKTPYVNGIRIYGVSDPTDPNEAVNKNYVDSKGFIVDNNGILSWG